MITSSKFVNFNYRTIVESFSSRFLSFESDILDAFSGRCWQIYQEILGNRCPISILVLVLSEGCNLFCRFRREHHPLALWTAPSVTADGSRLRIVHDDSKSHISPDNASNTCGYLAWKWGCFPERCPIDLNPNDCTWQELLNEVNSHRPNFFVLQDNAWGYNPDTQDVNDSGAKYPPSLIQKAQAPGRILVHVQSLRVYATLPPKRQPDGFDGDSIKLGTEFGVQMGWLFPTMTDLEILYSIYEHSPQAWLDTLAISRGRQESEDGQVPGGYGLAYMKEVLSWKDCTGTPLETNVYPMAVWVDLMIFETLDGVSRRVVLGQAYLAAWTKACPRSLTFVVA